MDACLTCSAAIRLRYAAHIAPEISAQRSPSSPFLIGSSRSLPLSGDASRVPHPLLSPSPGLPLLLFAWVAPAAPPPLLPHIITLFIAPRIAEGSTPPCPDCDFCPNACGRVLDSLGSRSPSDRLVHLDLSLPPMTLPEFAALPPSLLPPPLYFTWAPPPPLPSLVRSGSPLAPFPIRLLSPSSPSVAAPLCQCRRYPPPLRFHSQASASLVTT